MIWQISARKTNKMATDDSVACSKALNEDDDDDDYSGDEEDQNSDGRRRRFCTERKQESSPTPAQNNYHHHHNQSYNNHNHHLHSQHPHPSHPHHQPQYPQNHQHHHSQHHYNNHQQQFPNQQSNPHFSAPYSARPPAAFVNKRPRLDHDPRHQRFDHSQRAPRGRRGYWQEASSTLGGHVSPLKVIPTAGGNLSSATRIDHYPTQTQNEQKPKGLVIYINPKFVRKFIEKSLQLSQVTNSTPPSKGSAGIPSDGASTSSIVANLPNANQTSSGPTSAADDQQQQLQLQQTSHGPTTTTIALNDKIDFKTTPREALQSASTMTIVRLVTESIQADFKRNERLNKVLVMRLIDQLVNNDGHGPGSEDSPRNHGLTSLAGNESERHKMIQDDMSSKHKSRHPIDLGSTSGRPIPVIGGSVNNYYNDETP